MMCTGCDITDYSAFEHLHHTRATMRPIKAHYKCKARAVKHSLQMRGTLANLKETNTVMFKKTMQAMQIKAA